MPVHKDQTRVREALIPSLIAMCMEESPEAARGATLLNRLFIQGADPLFLMEAAAGTFEKLCFELQLDPAKGRDAIEKAHWMGPATLLDGKGWDGLTTDLTEMHKCEIVWLHLANMSDCVEDGYGEQVSFKERITRAFTCVEAMASVNLDRADILVDAALALEDFRDTANFTLDDKNFPHSDQDHAFYVAYKTGHKVCCVHTPTMDFWGTTDATTLEEQGITVDKPISPHFGIVFHKTE